MMLVERVYRAEQVGSKNKVRFSPQPSVFKPKTDAARCIVDLKSMLADGMWHHRDEYNLVLNKHGISFERVRDHFFMAIDGKWICIPMDHTPLDPPGN